MRVRVRGRVGARARARARVRARVKGWGWGGRGVAFCRELLAQSILGHLDEVAVRVEGHREVLRQRRRVHLVRARVRAFGLGLVSGRGAVFICTAGSGEQP